MSCPIRAPSLGLALIAPINLSFYASDILGWARTRVVTRATSQDKTSPNLTYSSTIIRTATQPIQKSLVYRTKCATIGLGVSMAQYGEGRQLFSWGFNVDQIGGT